MAQRKKVKYHSDWRRLSGLSSETLQSYFEGNVKIFDALRVILEDRIKALEKDQCDQESYAISAWPYFQADLIGAKRELKRVMDLLPRYEDLDD